MDEFSKAVKGLGGMGEDASTAPSAATPATASKWDSFMKLITVGSEATAKIIAAKPAPAAKVTNIFQQQTSVPAPGPWEISSRGIGKNLKMVLIAGGLGLGGLLVYQMMKRRGK